MAKIQPLVVPIIYLKDTKAQARIRILERYVITAARAVVEETQSEKDQARLQCLDLAVAQLDRAIRNLRACPES